MSSFSSLEFTDVVQTLLILFHFEQMKALICEPHCKNPFPTITNITGLSATGGKFTNIRQKTTIRGTVRGNQTSEGSSINIHRRNKADLVIYSQSVLVAGKIVRSLSLPYAITHLSKNFKYLAVTFILHQDANEAEILKSQQSYTC